MKYILGLFLLISGVLNGFSQAVTVSGKVISSDDKQPIPGVNVIVQGTSKGTATDIEGNYTLTLAEGETTLVFTFVGYTSVTEKINGRAVVDITMESDTKTLQEVVVVGYGVQKKSDITGATANVKGEDLVRQPVLTATQALQGKVSGIQIISSGQPGSSPQIRVRGVSTAFANTTSLFVVDGVLTDDISNINTSDIVDMNILKDASASAIYGSRGANGVIIITTRKGVKGALKVNYSTQVGFREAANLVKMANADEYINYITASTGQPPSSTQPAANTDWYKTILRRALEQTHNVSVSGGSDKSTYLFNAGYMNDQGIIVGNSFKRLTLRLNSDYQFNDKLKLGVQSSYSNGINQNGFNNLTIDANGNVGGVYGDAYRAAPIIPNIINGLYGNTSVFQNVGNPLLDIRDNDVKVDNNRLQGSTYLQFEPVKGITLRSSIGADWQNTLSRLYNYKFLASGPNNVFLATDGNQLNQLSGLNIQNQQAFRWVWDNTAAFNKKIDDHEFTLLVGTTAEKYSTNTFSGRRNNVPADKSLWYLDNGNANSSQNTGNGDAWARNSYLSRFNYGYQGKYLLTATFRRDGSSRLPKENRWQNYPSVGAAWVLSNEQFMANAPDYLNFLKIRGSWGKVGNDQIPTNSFVQTVSQNQAYPFNGHTNPATPGSQIQVIIDPHITWEVTTEYDLAIEFGLLQNKLSGEVNYYHKQLNNGIDQVPILGTVGANPATIISNVMGIQNKGFEFVLNWKDNINENWSYTISANATFNKNTITALNGGQNIYDGAVGSQGFVTNTDIGHPVGSFYVLQTAGVFNTADEVTNDPVKYNSYTKAPGSFKYLDRDKNGVIDLNDRVFAGSYQPVAYYGINLGTRFKSLDMSMSIYGNAGNKVYNGKRASRIAGLDNIEESLVYNRWTPSSPSQTQPGANTGNLPASTYFVESGSFMRINNLTFGYNFSPAALTRLRMTTFRLFVTSQNLFTLKKYSGFTAELPGGPTNSGIESQTYPTTRTVAVGLNVGF